MIKFDLNKEKVILIKEIIRHKNEHNENVRDEWKDVKTVTECENIHDVFDIYKKLVDRYDVENFYVEEFECFVIHKNGENNKRFAKAERERLKKLRQE